MRVTTKLVVIVSFIAALAAAGCFEIKTIVQPTQALGGAQITSTLTVAVEGISDANPHYGIIGLLIPNDWKVDTVYFDGAYTDYATFLHPDSSDKEPGGKVDYWADSLEGRFPSGANYQWVVYQSSKAHAVINDSVDVNLTVKMTTSATQGNFEIGYFTTDAALDFDDPDNYSVRLGNAIQIEGIVPVELTSFAASTSKEGVRLNWETATETNNRGFEIEKSADNKTFKSVAFVKGNGTTTVQNRYSYLDKNAEVGVNYYRLKQIDMNGAFEYSKSVEVDFSVPNEYGLGQNYPNPFNPSTAIEFSIPVDAKVTITLYNSLGEAVRVLTNNNYSAGRHTLNLSAQGLTSGTYIYSISATGADGSKFVKSNKMIYLK